MMALMTEQPELPLAVRAQMLATEHWSLLAVVYPAHHGYRQASRFWTVRFPAPGHASIDSR
jgi:hypothetical protein